MDGISNDVILLAETAYLRSILSLEFSALIVAIILHLPLEIKLAKIFAQSKHQPRHNFMLALAGKSGQ